MNINENYLKEKLDLLLHELDDYLLTYGKYMHKDDVTALKKITDKHKKTLASYGTSANDGFVPLNLDREPNK